MRAGGKSRGSNRADPLLAARSLPASWPLTTADNLSVTSPAEQLTPTGRPLTVSTFSASRGLPMGCLVNAAVH